MTALIPIQPGQWVLTYVDHFYPGYFDGDMAGALERLVAGGSGWDCLRKASDQFEVLQAVRVMPKTYLCASPSVLYPGTTIEERRHRQTVVATASTAGELLALRDKLFAIGFAADRAIQDETVRLISDFARKTRADALAKIHAALPHIFGRQHERRL